MARRVRTGRPHLTAYLRPPCRRMLNAYYAGPLLEFMHAGRATCLAPLVPSDTLECFSNNRVGNELPCGLAHAAVAASAGPPLQPAFIMSLSCQAALFFKSLGVYGPRRAPLSWQQERGVWRPGTAKTDKATIACAALTSYVSTGLIGSNGTPSQLGMLLSCCLAYHNLPLPCRVLALAADALPNSTEMLPLLHRLRDDPDAVPHVVALRLAMPG